MSGGSGSLSPSTSFDKSANKSLETIAQLTAPGDSGVDAGGSGDIAPPLPIKKNTPRGSITQFNASSGDDVRSSDNSLLDISMTSPIKSVAAGKTDESLVGGSVGESGMGIPLPQENPFPEDALGPLSPLQPERTGGKMQPLQPERTGGKMQPLQPERTGGSMQPLQPQKTGENLQPLQPERTGGKMEPLQPERTGGKMQPLQPERTGGKMQPLQPERTGGKMQPLQPEWTGGKTQPLQPERTGGKMQPLQPEWTGGKSASEKLSISIPGGHRGSVSGSSDGARLEPLRPPPMERRITTGTLPPPSRKAVQRRKPGQVR